MSSLKFDANGKWENSESPKEADFFALTTKTGFLPTGEPYRKLPDRYAELEKLLGELYVWKEDGSYGLLGKNEFRAAVKERLPNYLEQVKQETESRLICALYRDYCVIASAYALEQVDYDYRHTKKYGTAESVLIASIAQPLDHVAKQIQAFPWLEYCYGYALGNFFLEDPSKGFEFENIKIIRLIAGVKDEAGFTQVHIQMEALSGQLIEQGVRLLRAVEEKDHAAAQSALNDLAETAHEINTRRETMWERCNYKEYLTFRTWIYGIYSTNFFPNDVLHYEGCENPERSYRGETGAQSTLIPFLDTVLGLNKHYPQNELTKYLMELRVYRPVHHRNFLREVENVAGHLKLHEFCLEDPNTTVGWLRVLDEVRAFRQGHWNFTKAYIIGNTTHPYATGGTPITTWLPNQLGATMEYMKNLMDDVDANVSEKKLNAESTKYYDEIKAKHQSLVDYLMKEVNELRTKYNQ